MTKFVSDCSCDLHSIQGVNFTAVPLTISSDHFHFTDDENLDIHFFLDTLAGYKGRSYTACPSVEDWLKAYEGADELYVTPLTSLLSGSYNSAMVAAEQYCQEHPKAKIMVFDTLTTGPELRLLIEKLVALKQSGSTFEEICAAGKEYLKHTRLFFAFKSLHNFAQNGRVNKAVAAAVGVLGISILGTASEEGNIAPRSKCRGEKKVISELLSMLEEAGYQGGKLRICHIENEPFATKVANAISEKFGTSDSLVYPAAGLCSYYGERGGIILGCES